MMQQARQWFADRLAPERRALSTRDPYLAQYFGIRGTAAGQTVSPERATGIAAVHACVQLIAETIATLPLNVYRRTDEGRTVDRMHPLHRVLHEQSNKVQTAVEFREQLLASVLLTGNGFARKVIDGRGAVIELVPLHPDRVRVEQLPNGCIRYQHTTQAGGSETLLQDEVLHLRYRSRDGITGLSPIGIARETIATALAQQETEGALYRNGVRPSGVLKMPGSLHNTEAYARLRDSFESAFAGTTNAARVLILEEGLDWQPISMSFADAQFVETRKLTLEDIARVFRVPPPAIGILDRATYSNITEQGRWLVMHTLRPWAVRIEQVMSNSLLTVDGRRAHFIEHNFEGLLRGNQKDRFEW